MFATAQAHVWLLTLAFVTLAVTWVLHVNLNFAKLSVNWFTLTAQGMYLRIVMRYLFNYYVLFSQL